MRVGFGVAKEEICNNYDDGRKHSMQNLWNKSWPRLLYNTTKNMLDYSSLLVKIDICF